METARYFFAIGVTVFGIGMTLFVQGQALRNPHNTKAFGYASWGFGIVYSLGGLALMVLALTSPK